MQWLLNTTHISSIKWAARWKVSNRKFIDSTTSKAIYPKINNQMMILHYTIKMKSQLKTKSTTKKATVLIQMTHFIVGQLPLVYRMLDLLGKNRIQFNFIYLLWYLVVFYKYHQHNTFNKTSFCKNNDTKKTTHLVKKWYLKNTLEFYLAIEANTYSVGYVCFVTRKRIQLFTLI